MKKLMMLAMLTALTSGLGCTTPGKSLPKDTKDLPDEPAAVVEHEVPPTVEKIMPPKTRIDADEIDNSNYLDQAKQLESELKYERGAGKSK
jgi:hypothetical protein